ncbi:hypothetical protein Tco_0024789 [Tanacetum coccineum]
MVWCRSSIIPDYDTLVFSSKVLESLQEALGIRLDMRLRTYRPQTDGQTYGIMEREFKKLKRSRIAIVKVRWNSKRSPEFTWEREDQMKLKYRCLFSDVL